MKAGLSVVMLNFKGAIRDRFFSGAVFFFLFYLAFSILLGEMSWEHSDKVLRNAGLVGMELTAIILIITSFSFGFFRERESRILEVYLTNFKRSTYIFGKISGYWLISFFYLFFSGLVYSAILYLYNAFNIACLLALYPLFLKMAIMVCFSSIFSCLFSSSIISLLSCLFLYIASALAPSALKLVHLQQNPWQRFLVETIYTFLPNMDKLDNIRSSAVYGIIPPTTDFILITLYALVYIICLWLINIFIFQRKEY